jgi:hypothetical protein
MYEGVAQARPARPSGAGLVQPQTPGLLRDMAGAPARSQPAGAVGEAKAEMLDSMRQIANQAEGVLETQQFNRVSRQRSLGAMRGGFPQ